MVTNSEPLHDPCGHHLSLEWVNSLNRVPGVVSPETICEYADLLLWSTQAGTLSPERSALLNAAGRRALGEAEAVRERAVALRENLFRIFGAIAEGKRPTRADCSVLNAELALAQPHLRVEPTAQGFDWAWSEETEALAAPIWPLVRGAAELLVSPELELVRECASERCLWLFLDRTRNHKRRWCDMKVCGNRAKVRHHRERQRAKKRS